MNVITVSWWWWIWWVRRWGVGSKRKKILVHISSTKYFGSNCCGWLRWCLGMTVNVLNECVTMENISSCYCSLVVNRRCFFFNFSFFFSFGHLVINCLWVERWSRKFNDVALSYFYIAFTFSKLKKKNKKNSTLLQLYTGSDWSYRYMFFFCCFIDWFYKFWCRFKIMAIFVALERLQILMIASSNSWDYWNNPEWSPEWSWPCALSHASWLPIHS